VRTAIVVAPSFEAVWPFAADRLRQLLEPSLDVDFVRVGGADTTLADAVSDAAAVERLIVLGLPLAESDLAAFPSLAEACVSTGYGRTEADGLLEARGIRVLGQTSEGFWGQSVSEFALGLTIGALRRIPQTHHAILTSQDAWTYPRQQYGDDSRFTNGTVEGKRIRIVGAGNIASRYASFVRMLGADVAAWDPFASEPSFHRAGSRREQSLERLVQDAEIFVPMVPLTPGTEGLVTADLIRSIPTGALVVLATRAAVCDMPTLRERVLADELALAADVFDVEPLPLTDPLLGRDNVVHTPHNAGRTKEANFRWAEMLAEQLPEFDRNQSPLPAPVS